MASWEHDGNKVFDGVAPTSWTDLDLKLIAGGGSTEHPTARTLALLKVVNSSGWPYMAFRPDGVSFDTYSNDSGGHGCVVITPNSSTGDAALVFLPTSTSGLIEWKSQTASNVEIWLVGFIEADVSDQEVFASGALPSSWTDLDLTEDTVSAPTGLTEEALAYLWYHRTGGTKNEIATRPNGGRVNFLGTNMLGGCSQGQPTASGKYESYVMKTDSSGLIEHIAASTVPNAEVILASFIQDGFSDIDAEIFPSATPPTVWTELDISSQVGNNRALVMLEVHNSSASPGSIFTIAFRADDDTADYLPGSIAYPIGVAAVGLNADGRSMVLVETGPSGKLEWKALSTVRDVDIRIAGYMQPVVTTVVHTYLNLRVDFGEAMKDDAELRDPSNYRIIVDDPTTAYDFEATLVTPEEGVSEPTYVDLTMTDCTGGKAYNLFIPNNTLKNAGDAYIGEVTVPFTGVTEDPDVLSVESLSLTTMRVTFSKVMAINEELKDISNYTFTGGLNVLEVTLETNSSVILTTTEQTPAEIYDLTVS